MKTEYPDMSSLTVKELLSLALRESSGSPVIDDLTCRYVTLRDLASATFEELTGINRLGQKKAAALLASIELARRLYSTPPGEQKSIRGPQDVANLLMGEMYHLDREHFKVILLNTKHRVIKLETVSIGTLNTSMVHPRELFKSAIRHSAAAVILVHNHPSGITEPSREDIDITKRLVDAGSLLGIEVLDHIIIGDGDYASLKEKGLLL